MSTPSNPFELVDIISSDIDDSNTVGIITEGPTVNNSILYVAATLPSSANYNILRLVKFYSFV